MICFFLIECLQSYITEKYMLWSCCTFTRHPWGPGLNSWHSGGRQYLLFKKFSVLGIAAYKNMCWEVDKVNTRSTIMRTEFYKGESYIMSICIHTNQHHTHKLFTHVHTAYMLYISYCLCCTRVRPEETAIPFALKFSLCKLIVDCGKSVDRQQSNRVRGRAHGVLEDLVVTHGYLRMPASP